MELRLHIAVMRTYVEGGSFDFKGVGIRSKREGGLESLFSVERKG
jgi:hypothetical protein